MRIIEKNLEGLTELCHANFGDMVRLVDADLVVVPTIFLVARDPNASKSTLRIDPFGLYACANQVRLVDLLGGSIVRPPSLSQRCIILKDAELHL